MANIIRGSESERAPLTTGWEPLRVMRELLGWDPFAEMLPALRGETVTFAPKFEVHETKDAYVFKADVPGIEDKDLDITLTGNRLTVSGKREAEGREEGVTYYAYERSYGSFSRSFTLPEGSDFDHAAAEVKSGVLTVSIPKKPESQARKISLKGLGEKVKGALGGKEKGSA
jgi:HSP20 family protein